MLHASLCSRTAGSMRLRPAAAGTRAVAVVHPRLRPGRCSLAVVAVAKRDDQGEPIDVKVTAVGGAATPKAPASIEEARRTAEGAVEDAADAATATFDLAAKTASDVVSDASDVAAAVVDDAATAASATVRQVQEAEQATRSAVTSNLGDLIGQPAPIDWQQAGERADGRFAGMKVLVVGATGGVGRRVVQALRAKGVPCRALVRDRSRAADLLPTPTTSSAAAIPGSTAPAVAAAPAAPAPEFEIVTGDVYQFATLPPALKGCNALVVASAANDKADPFGPFNIDYQGTLNLIAAAKRAGVKHFVYVTSIGADDPFNPLNLFWGILFWKKRAEEELQRSGLSYTIVRPGGLKNSLASSERQGNVVMEGPNTFGFPPMKRSGSILRSQVADVCVEALVSPAAADKVVEVVAETSAPERSLAELFERVSV